MTTPNPWERLRAEAERVCECDISSAADHRRNIARLREALAALPATPPEQPVPAPPASDWRERFMQQHKAARKSKSKMLRGEHLDGFTPHAVDFADDVICALAAMHDGLAALEAEVANLRSQVLP